MKNRNANWAATAILCCALAVTGCSGRIIHEPAASTASEHGARIAYEAAREEAEAMRRKAESVDGEWRDIGPLLERAAAEAKTGNYGKAKALAEEARILGELGYQQMRNQQKLENPLYLIK